MKTTASFSIHHPVRLLGVCIVAAFSALAITVTAAESPPEFMTYQGYLVDGNGDALGTGSPASYDVVFSIYKEPVNGSPVWSEQQNVTIAEGYFSVLLGEGGGGNISQVFSGGDASDRFIQIAVKGLNPSAPTEIVPILPRLKLVSSPYAFLATRVVADAIGSDEIADGSVKSAEIADSTITSADILDGTITSDDISNYTITSSDMGFGSVDGYAIADGSVASADILNGSIASIDIADETITSADILNNSITSSDILNGTIASADIADNSIQGSDILNGTITSSDLAYLSSLNAGNIGIGTTSTTYPLEVAGYAYSHMVAGFWFAWTSEQRNSGGTYDNPVSIKAQYGIESGSSLYVTSDRRIKKNLKASDPELDLDILANLKVTDYNYIDTASYGEQRKKGFIAQEVATVFPQAVKTSTGVVPDIYESAACKDGWVELATDLKKGERVRLVSEDADGIYEVLDVTKDKFRTDFKPQGDKLIVFGREVNDFHAVDYDAIAVLNVSVTQKLVVQMDELKRENTELKIQLQELAKQLEELVLQRTKGQ